MMNLDKVDEEFNNFMHKVNDVHKIVKQLSSDNKEIQEIGKLEADKYLKSTQGKEILNEDSVELVVNTNKSVINKKALYAPEKDENTMTQEAFKAEISRDAEQRRIDRLVRQEKCDTFKKQGANAFRRGEYEKSLSCYNKAIEQIRDSPQLYLNRCLNYINLKLYDKAIDDARTALKLNEDSLKAWLLLAKACYIEDNIPEYTKAIEEAKTRNPEQIEFIQEFEVKLKTEVQ